LLFVIIWLVDFSIARFYRNLNRITTENRDNRTGPVVLSIEYPWERFLCSLHLDQ